MIDIKERKMALRRNMKELLVKMPSDKLMSAGKAVACHIESWLNNNFIGTNISAAYFASFKDEIDTSFLEELLLKNLASRALPISSSEGLVFKKLQQKETSRSYASDLDRELLDPRKLDLIFVPGLSFDRQGRRLGRGRGDFDRLLAKLSFPKKTPILIGLAMDEQVLKEIPHESHDVPMDFICTPLFGMMAMNQRDL